MNWFKRDGNEIDNIYDDYNRLDKIVYPALSEVDYDNLNEKKMSNYGGGIIYIHPL